jgi:UDP-N-acetylmuramate--alanine ligase
LAEIAFAIDASIFLQLLYTVPMNNQKHIHCIGIGGIGISALARYYLAQGYRVTGTNMGHSPLLDTLASEGIEIVSDGASVISEMTEKIIYTEAIIDDDSL